MSRPVHCSTARSGPPIPTDAAGANRATRLRKCTSKYGEHLLHRGTPLTGKRLTFASKNRTGVAFAHALKRIARRYKGAAKIHLVLDNLSTHTEISLTVAFGQSAGVRLWATFRDSVHASWLNAAEMEARLVSRECLGVRKLGDLESLRHEVSQWRVRIEKSRGTINSRFTVKDARRIFRYDGLITSRSQQH